MANCSNYLLPIAVFHNERGGIKSIRYLQYTLSGALCKSISSSTCTDWRWFECTAIEASNMKYMTRDLSFLQVAIYNKARAAVRTYDKVCGFKSITRLDSNGVLYSDTLMVVCRYQRHGTTMLRVVDWRGQVRDIRAKDLVSKCIDAGLSLGNWHEKWYLNFEVMRLDGFDCVLQLNSKDLMFNTYKARYSLLKSVFESQGFSCKVTDAGLLAVGIARNMKRVIVPREVDVLVCDGIISECEALALPDECDVNLSNMSNLKVFKAPSTSVEFIVRGFKILDELTVPAVVRSESDRPGFFVLQGEQLPENFRVLDCSKYDVVEYMLHVRKCYLEQISVPIGVMNSMCITLFYAPYLRKLCLINNQLNGNVSCSIDVYLGGLSGDVEIQCDGNREFELDLEFAITDTPAFVHIRSNVRVNVRLSLPRLLPIVLFVGKDVALSCNGSLYEGVVSSIQEEKNLIDNYKQRLNFTAAVFAEQF